MCVCKLQLKTGLPCKHILKILICNQMSVLRQIDTYWVLSSKEEREIKRNIMIEDGKMFPKKGIPKFSRRNMKKWYLCSYLSIEINGIITWSTVIVVTKLLSIINFPCCIDDDSDQTTNKDSEDTTVRISITMIQ